MPDDMVIFVLLLVAAVPLHRFLLLVVVGERSAPFAALDRKIKEINSSKNGGEKIFWTLLLLVLDNVDR